MRIIMVDNFQMRRFGKVKVSTNVKLYNGLTRGNHQVLQFSDRDVAALEGMFGLRDLGHRGANRRLVETCANWRPDLVMLGHCDIIANKTLQEIRRAVPGVRIVYRNVDPPFEPENIARIESRRDFVDAIFMTTGGELLQTFVRPTVLAAFIPNPTDPAVENVDNSARPAAELDIDLVFCGVGNEGDERRTTVDMLHQGLRERVEFHSYGMFGRPAIWGYEYDRVLARSKMGLNLNRFEGHYLYSSARMSQLMGNGLLTFTDHRSGYARFFASDQAVLFQGPEDLLSKVLAFQADDAARRHVAGRGRAYYQEHFSAERVGQFIVETTFGLPYSYDYVWADQVFRA